MNADLTIVLERPKVSPFADAMRERLATALGIDVERISLKAKTNEGVDAVGAGEAVACHAVVLIARGVNPGPCVKCRCRAPVWVSSFDARDNQHPHREERAVQAAGRSRDDVRLRHDA